MTSAMLFAFAAGAVSAVNPCGFALLPVWFARQLGENTGFGVVARFMRVLRAGLLATLGFVVIFGLAGAFLTLGMSLMGPALPWIGLGVGGVVAIVGIAGLFEVWARFLPGRDACRKIGDRHGSMVFGIGYGLLSLSCTLPVFLAVLGVALTDNLFGSGLNLLAFSAGMGTILTSIGLGAAFLRAGIGPLSPVHVRILRKLSAALVTGAGLYVTFYWGRVVFGDVMVENSLVSAGDLWSSLARGWLGSTPGRWLTGAVFGLLSAGAVVGLTAYLRDRGGSGDSGVMARQHRANPKGKVKIGP